MKELSIEEKAKCYDEAIERAQSLKNKWIDEDGEDVAFMIFPELKENEDEKIRKKLISFVENWDKGGIVSKYTSNANDIKRILAWLKKQGEQNLIKANSPQLGEQKSAKNIVETWKDMRLEVYQQASGNRHEPNYSDDTTKMFSLNDIDEIIEKMSEQKLADKVEPKDYSSIDPHFFKTTDKVEPKFHEGEWVVYDGRTTRILKVTHDGYVNNKQGFIPKEREDCMRLWDITKDAKDGDVLACNNGWTCIFKTLVNDENFSSYCFMDNTKWFCETGSECHTLKEEFVKVYNGKLYPATKEQRDTFERAMADAGYAFDFDKKELKKIEKPIEWSYEDEANLNNIIWLCNNCIKGTETTWIPSQATKIKHLIETIKEEGLAQQNPAWSEEDEQIILSIEQAMNCASLLNVVPVKMDKIRAWLKSLKDRCTWKPSSLQMECLHDAIKHYHTNGYPASKLKELYEQMSKIYKL